MGVAVFGIVQGTLAFFHALDSRYGSSLYFRFKGMVGVHGWLRGKVDFIIISISVDIDIEADVAFIFAEYEPIHLAISAHVKASAKVKVLFVTKHFSYSFHFHKAFTVGSGSTPPWDRIPAPASPPQPIAARSMAPRLSTRGGLAPMMAFDLSEQAAPLDDIAQVDAAASTNIWASGFAYPIPAAVTPTLYLMPMISADQEGSTLTPTVIATFQIENPNPVDDPQGTYKANTSFGAVSQAMLAWTLAATLGKSSWADLKDVSITAEHLEDLHAQLTGEVPLHAFVQLDDDSNYLISPAQSQAIHHSLLQQGYLDVNSAVTAKFVPGSTTLTFPMLDFMNDYWAKQVGTILQRYAQPNQWFEYDELQTFLSATFTGDKQFVVKPRNTKSHLSTTIFPIPENFDVKIAGATQVQSNTTVTTDQLKNLNKYISQAAGLDFKLLPQGDSAKTMSEYVVLDYFRVIAATALANAKNLIAALPYTIQAKDSLHSITSQDKYNYLTPLDIVEANATNDKILSDSGWAAIEDSYALVFADETLTSLADDLLVIPAAGQPAQTKLAVIDLAIPNQSLAGLLVPGQTITLTKYSFTPPESPTVAEIAKQFYTTADKVTSVDGGYLPADQTLSALTQLHIANIQFKVADATALNTVNKIAYHFGIAPTKLVRQNPTLSSHYADWNKTLVGTTAIKIDTIIYTVPPNSYQSINQYFGATALSAMPEPGKALTLDVNYTVKANDSLFSIAAYLSLTVTKLCPDISDKTITPGMHLTLPPHAYPIQPEDTFISIANDHHLSLEALTTANETNTLLFTPNTYLSLPGKVTVSDLVTHLDQNDAADKSIVPGSAAVARAVNRLMLSGQRIPDPTKLSTKPADWPKAKTYPLLTFTGDVFKINQASSLAITLPATGVPSWINLTSDLSFNFAPEEISLAQNIVEAVQSIKPPAITMMDGWNHTEQRYLFGHSITWQRPEKLAAKKGQAENAVKKPALNKPALLWKFPQALNTALSKAEETGLKLTPCQGWYDGSLISGQAPLKTFQWASLITLNVRPVAKLSGSAGDAGPVYTVTMNSLETNRAHALSDWLTTNQGYSVQLTILYNKPSAETGLVSDITTDADRQAINVISLSTSDQGTLGLDKPAAVLPALQSGIYLNYEPSTKPDGLPAYLFTKQSKEAEIYLLATLTPPEDGFKVPVPACVDALVSHSNLNTHTNVVYVQSADPHYQHHMAVGTVGFQTDAFDPPTDADPTKEMAARMFQMVGYGQVDDKGMPITLPGLPVPPSHPKDATGYDAQWLYQKVITINPNPTPNYDTFTALPDKDLNPYRHIVLTKDKPTAIQLRYHLRDLFGNQYQPTDYANSSPITFYYQDPLLGISSWPNVSASYDFSKNVGPQLNMYLNFSTAKYLHQSETSLDAMLNSVKSDQATYSNIYYQLIQPDVTLSSACSMGTPAKQPDLTQLQTDFVEKIYTYLATLSYLGSQGKLTQSDYEIVKGDSLSKIAQTHLIDALDLAMANRTIEGAFDTTTSIQLPMLYQVSGGQTLTAIAKAANAKPYKPSSPCTVQTIAALNAQTANILKPGVTLTLNDAPKTSYIIQADDTLASIVQAFSKSDDSFALTDLVTALQDAACWQAGVQLIIYTTSVTPSASDSLNSILQQAISTNESINKGLAPTMAIVLAANQADTDMHLNSTHQLRLALPQRWKVAVTEADYKKGLSIRQVSSTGGAKKLSDLAQELANQGDLYLANSYLTHILDATKSVQLSGTATNATGQSVSLPVTCQLSEFETLASLFRNLLNTLATSLFNTLSLPKPDEITVSFTEVTQSIVLALPAHASIREIYDLLLQKIDTAVFVDLIQDQAVFKAGAWLLDPPTQWVMQTEIKPKSPAIFTKISATLTLKRDEKLINPALDKIPQALVQTAETALSLHLSDNTGLTQQANDHSADNLSLKRFADTFQQCFPDYLVAAQSGAQHQVKALYAVPVGKSVMNFNIDSRNTIYFLNPPLSTQLVSQSNLALAKYVSGTGLKEGPNGDTVNLQGIDMDAYAKKFLKTFDQVMSPQSLATIYATAPEDLATILEARETIITGIKNSVVPVIEFSDSKMDVRQQHAQDALEAQLKQGLSNAYNVDSIVQLQSNITPNVPQYTSGIDPTTFSLDQGAEQLGNIPLLDFIAYNLHIPNILKKGEKITIDGKEHIIGYEAIWDFFVNFEPPDTFLDKMQIPNASKALTSFGDVKGIIANPEHLGKLVYIEAGTQTSKPVSIPVPANRQLDSIANDLMKPLKLTVSLTPYAIGSALKDVKGLFKDSTFTPGVVKKPEDGSGGYAKIHDQSLWAFYNSDQVNKKIDGCQTFNDFIIHALPFIKVSKDIKELTFEWQTVQAPDAPKSVNFADLTFEGQPVVPTITIDKDSNSLETFVTTLSKMDSMAARKETLTIGYTARVLADEKNLLAPEAPFTYKEQPYTVKAGETLQSLCDRVTNSKPTPVKAGEPVPAFPDRATNDKSTTATFYAFVNAIASEPILATGTVLTLSFLSYGAPITLQRAVDLLNADWRHVLWSNYGNAVVANPAKTDAPKPLSQTKALWDTRLPTVPVSEKPIGPLNDIHLLINNPPIGVLSLVADGSGKYRFVTKDGEGHNNKTSFDDFVKSIRVNHLGFDATFVATLIQDVSGAFAGEVTDINSRIAPFTFSKDNTLADAAKHFNLSVTEFIIQYKDRVQAANPEEGEGQKKGKKKPPAAKPYLMMAEKTFSFNWTTIQDVAARPTLAQIANYFDVDVQEVIEANWETKGLIATGVHLTVNAKDYNTTKDDTLSKIAEKLGFADEGAFPPDKTFFETHEIIYNAYVLEPLARPNVLSLQPSTAFTSSRVDLDNKAPYSTFLMTQAGIPKRRVGLDVRYTAQKVLASSELMGTKNPAPLTLVTPQAYDLADLEIPIPLRSFPNTPVLLDQAVSPYHPKNSSKNDQVKPIMSVDDAKSWVYQFDYSFNGTSQDEVEISLELNGAATTGTPTSTGDQASADKYNPELFVALANFIHVMPPLVRDLNLLPSVQGKSDSPTIKKAISSFATLAQAIAKEWHIPAKKTGTGKDQPSAGDHPNQADAASTPQLVVTYQAADVSKEVSKPKSTDPTLSPAGSAFKFKVQELFDEESNTLSITVSSLSGQPLPGGFSLPVVYPGDVPPNNSVQKPDKLNIVPAPPVQDQRTTYAYTIEGGKLPPAKRTVIFDNRFDIMTYRSSASAPNTGVWTVEYIRRQRGVHRLPWLP
ncbi:MAG: LysM domain-containing protein [Chloroflexota bacterium]